MEVLSHICSFPATDSSAKRVFPFPRSFSRTFIKRLKPYFGRSPTVSCLQSNAGNSSPPSVTAPSERSIPARKTYSDDLYRIQNAKCLSFLEDAAESGNSDALVCAEHNAEEYEEEEEERLKKILEENDEAPDKAAPKFPGTVYGAGAFTAEQFFEDGRGRGGSEWEDAMLREALSLRRLRIRQILKDEMMTNRLSNGYSDNLIAHMQGFIDHLIIKAAAAKENPELSTSSFTVRVKFCIEESEIVPLVKWLKHKQLSYPRIGILVSSAAGDLDRLRLLIRWLRSVHVKGRYLGKLLVRQQIVLDRPIDELDALVQLLENNGVRIDWVGSVLSHCPEILSFSLEELQRRVNFFLNLGMNHKDFGTMVFEYPRALGRFSLTDMTKKVAYLKEFGLGDTDVGRLLASRPELLACNIEDKWKPLVKYLFYLGVEVSGMKRILANKPTVFLLDLTNNISPKVRFLREIGVRNEDIGEIIVEFPAFLTYSLDNKIRPVVRFLLEVTCVPEEEIGKVLASAPKLFGCSIKDKLELTTKYFIAVGMSPPMLSQMVINFPILLKYNLSIIRPKYRYLKRVMVRPLQDIVKFPRFFSYSLTDRIIPRHNILVDNGLNLTLQDMLVPGDEEFAERVKDALVTQGKLDGNVNVPFFDRFSSDQSSQGVYKNESHNEGSDEEDNEHENEDDGEEFFNEGLDEDDG